MISNKTVHFKSGSKSNLNESEELNTSDSDEDSGRDNDSVKNSDVPNSNIGWADAMSKILKTNKPKGKKSIVLAKAKKLNEVNKTKLKEEGENKKENIRKHDWECRGRSKPNVLDQNREKTLSKIATKGIVQLFNVVRQQQKTIDSSLKEAGNSLRKQDRVMQSLDKTSFLDTLMSADATSEIVDNDVKLETFSAKEEIKGEKSSPENMEEDSKTELWHVLREDFMTSGKVKDWDKDNSLNNVTPKSVKKRKLKH